VRFSFAGTPGKRHISTPGVVMVDSLLIYAASSAVNGCNAAVERVNRESFVPLSGSGHSSPWTSPPDTPPPNITT